MIGWKISTTLSGSKAIPTPSPDPSITQFISCQNEKSAQNRFPDLRGLVVVLQHGLAAFVSAAIHPIPAGPPPKGMGGCYGRIYQRVPGLAYGFTDSGWRKQQPIIQPSG